MSYINEEKALKRCLIPINRRYLPIDCTCRTMRAFLGMYLLHFLSLYAYCKLELLLKKAGLNKKITPLDLIFEFSKVYYINFGESGKVMEIPKKIRDIEAKLGLNIFPT